MRHGFDRHLAFFPSRAYQCRPYVHAAFQEICQATGLKAFHEGLEKGLVVTGEYHMVISDRVAEEIISAYIFFGHVEHNLCAAQVFFVQIAGEAGLACEMARQVSRNFEYGHVSCRQQPQMATPMPDSKWVLKP